MTVLKIYTDGGCSNNQSSKNIGGWGAILEFGEARKELCGGEKNTTNNRMEMTALIEAFSALKRKALEIDVFSDSSYLMDCFRKKWYIKWKQNGWMTTAKKPVENRDLWEKLFALTQEHNVRFYRVKGHVNLESETQIQSLYRKFLSWNGDSFTLDDFKYITAMNIRADALVHEGMKKA